MKNRPIRVLAVVHDMQRAGLESRLMDVMRNIDSSRIRIDVFTWSLKEGYYDAEIQLLGGTVYYNPPLSVKNMLRYPYYFRDFLLQHPEYQIVHAHQDFWCSVFCKGAYLAGVPVRIAHSRTAISGLRPEYLIKNLIKLPTRRYANYCFAVSGKAGRWLFGRRLWEKGRVEIWPNAIDAARFYYNPETRKQIRSRNGWEKSFVVMHVANFMPAKNHPFLIRIFERLAEKEPSAILVLVGSNVAEGIKPFLPDGECRKRIFCPGIRNDIHELLQGADAFLFPSLFEGLPGALAEAQAAGLPCVISDTIAEEACLIPAVTRLSLKNTPEAWAEEVLRFRGHKHLETKAAIEKAGFDIHTLVERLQDFYEKAIDEHD